MRCESKTLKKPAIMQNLLWSKDAIPACFARLYKKGSPYSITELRFQALIEVLGSQPAGDVNRKLDGRLPLLSARSAVTPATLKRAATNFAAW